MRPKTVLSTVTVDGVGKTSAATDSSDGSETREMVHADDHRHDQRGVSAGRAHPLAPGDRAGQLRPLRDLGPPAHPPMAFATQARTSHSIRDLTFIMNLMTC
jgi:hypothetical protein